MAGTSNRPFRKAKTMANMLSYCRFENTLADLRDCEDHFQDGDLSNSENSARARLIKLCAGIASDYGDPEDLI